MLQVIQNQNTKEPSPPRSVKSVLQADVCSVCAAVSIGRTRCFGGFVKSKEKGKRRIFVGFYPDLFLLKCLMKGQEKEKKPTNQPTPKPHSMKGLCVFQDFFPQNFSSLTKSLEQVTLGIC